jgi:hypothetical protein
MPSHSAQRTPAHLFASPVMWEVGGATAKTKCSVPVVKGITWPDKLDETPNRKYTQND